MQGRFARVHNANTMQADLFLAVHHDSVPDQFKQNGNLTARRINSAIDSLVIRCLSHLTMPN